ncbi:hypothetical protein F01_460113 [Burkholderia cenocepacia]|nr:hypothetical protein F01_460113 [Burkholderia cenocepacia]
MVYQLFWQASACVTFPKASGEAGQRASRGVAKLVYHFDDPAPQRRPPACCEPSDDRSFQPARQPRHRCRGPLLYRPCAADSRDGGRRRIRSRCAAAVGAQPGRPVRRKPHAGARGDHRARGAGDRRGADRLGHLRVGGRCRAAGDVRSPARPRADRDAARARADRGGSRGARGDRTQGCRSRPPVFLADDDARADERQGRLRRGRSPVPPANRGIDRQHGAAAHGHGDVGLRAQRSAVGQDRGALSLDRAARSVAGRSPEDLRGDHGARRGRCARRDARAPVARDRGIHAGLALTFVLAYPRMRAFAPRCRPR